MTQARTNVSRPTASPQFDPNAWLHYAEGLERDLEEVTAALDWAKAPTTDDALDGLERALGDKPMGYKPAGRIRALYSRERIAANRLRGERDAASKALKDIHDELTNGPTANWDYIGKRFQEGMHPNG